MSLYLITYADGARAIGTKEDADEAVADGGEATKWEGTDGLGANAHELGDR